MEVTTMKKIHILTATAGILLALAGPSLAASRTQASQAPYGDRMNTVRTYGDRDNFNPPAERHLGYGAYARDEAARAYNYAPAQNRSNPYGSDPGEYYGGPNGW
jgi:hypothetical protein